MSAAGPDDRWADLERWRGGMDALLHAQIQRIGDFTITMQASNSDLDRNMNRRFDKLEVEQAEIKEQVKLTNGSVRDLKEWRARMEGQESGEMKVEAKIEQADEKLSKRREIKTSVLVGVLLVLVGLIGAVATLAAALITSH